MPEKISTLSPEEIAARFRSLFDLDDDEAQVLLEKIAEQKRLGAKKARKEMGTTVRLDYLTRFQVRGDEPLASSPITVRLPASVDKVVRSMPSSQRNEWLRKAICEAAGRELSS